MQIHMSITVHSKKYPQLRISAFLFPFLTLYWTILDKSLIETSKFD